MPRTPTLVLVVTLGALVVATSASAQEPVVVISAAGGGQYQSDLYTGPGQSLDAYVAVYDSYTWERIPNLVITFFGIGAYPHEGGHAHYGGGFSAWGTLSPNSTSTGPNGEGAPFRYTPGTSAGVVWPYVSFTLDGQFYTAAPQNGIIVGVSRNDLPYIGNGDFVLVGATSSHPDNHYGEAAFIDGLHQLATDYRNAWGYILAYNDSSLRRGMVFDLGQNYSPPHVSHQEGRSQDVRANGGAYSIPFDATIRQWFVQRVEEIFGQAPLHENPGTGNEHYHIRG